MKLCRASSTTRPLYITRRGAPPRTRSTATAAIASPLPPRLIMASASGTEYTMGYSPLPTRACSYMSATARMPSCSQACTVSMKSTMALPPPSKATAAGGGRGH